MAQQKQFKLRTSQVIPILATINQNFAAYLSQIAAEEGIDPRDILLHVDLTLTGDPMPEKVGMAVDSPAQSVEKPEN